MNIQTSTTCNLIYSPFISQKLISALKKIFCKNKAKNNLFKKKPDKPFVVVITIDDEKK